MTPQCAEHCLSSSAGGRRPEAVRRLSALLKGVQTKKIQLRGTSVRLTQVSFIYLFLFLISNAN